MSHSDLDADPDAATLQLETLDIAFAAMRGLHSLVWVSAVHGALQRELLSEEKALDSERLVAVADGGQPRTDDIHHLVEGEALLPCAPQKDPFAVKTGSYLVVRVFGYLRLPALSVPHRWRAAWMNCLLPTRDAVSVRSRVDALLVHGQQLRQRGRLREEVERPQLCSADLAGRMVGKTVFDKNHLATVPLQHH